MMKPRGTALATVLPQSAAMLSGLLRPDPRQHRDESRIDKRSAPQGTMHAMEVFLEAGHDLIGTSEPALSQPADE